MWRGTISVIFFVISHGAFQTGSDREKALAVTAVNFCPKILRVILYAADFWLLIHYNCEGAYNKCRFLRWNPFLFEKDAQILSLKLGEIQDRETTEELNFLSEESKIILL